MTARRNLEIKVRVDDLGSMERAARALGALDEGILHDVDTYFQVPRGRLKLRRTAGKPGATLISYHRPDLPGSRHSHYQLLHIEEPDALERILSRNLGVQVVIAKERHLMRYGSTRIHLDRVERLGTFVELETVIELQSDAEAASEHALVKEALGLEQAEAIPISYADLERLAT